ncbi:AAA family ATPase [Streptococcus suis]
MSFYIEKVSASGPTKKEVNITFTSGVNFVIGPSNTGKSCIAATIDYCLGSSSIPFSQSYGYDKVQITLVHKDGKLNICRIFNKNIVTISSNIPEINSGEYIVKSQKSSNKPSLSDVLLTLIGINEPVEVIKNSRYERNNLTWRTFSHINYVDQTAVGNKLPILVPTESTAKTGFFSSLIYLITSKDFSQYSSEIKREIIEAKNKALSEYVTLKLNELSQDKKQIEEQISKYKNIDIKKELEELFETLEKSESVVKDYDKKVEATLTEITNIKEGIVENNTLEKRYRSLQQQYLSDIKRLSLIVEGSENINNHTPLSNCPFCESEIQLDNNHSYVEVARSELTHILKHSEILDKTILDLNSEIKDQQEQLQTLNNTYEQLTNHIKTTLKPEIDRIKEKIAIYNEYTKLKDKLISIENTFIIYEQDLKNWSTHPSQENTKYLPRDNFPADFYDSMGNIIKNHLVECNYPDIQTVTFNKADFDVRINGMKKHENNGHGFRSFVNSIVALSLKEYMYKNANHNIGYLLIDSPTLGLDEEQDKKNSELMKKGLFNYLVSNHYSGQVIIMENIEHFRGVEIPHSNVIEFSKNGRQGFLDLE